ncbi:MAG TPA: cysteine desulfurase family protein [Bacteroidota bacterium]|nr:cysteine desulfurase family protein [Bacteroidota bacterium]
MRRVYLDHTATTPLDPQVFEAMKPYFGEKYGNASSIHRFGQEARAALDGSREVIARQLGASAGEISFVGSGTEADNMALKGVAWHMLREHQKNHIITSCVEHHAVLESCSALEDEGFAVSYIGVNESGRIDPDRVFSEIRPSTGLVSIMHANNEVGTINAVAELGRTLREQGILFHTDAVQSFGKIPIDVQALSVDLLSLSAHKIYGPKGIGAIFIRKGVALDRLLDGGGQERGRRAGTENVPLAVGFSKAAELMQHHGENEQLRIRGMRDWLLGELRSRFPFLIVNGDPANGLPHLLNISFDCEKICIDGEALLFNLDLAGIAVTSGSACTSGSMTPSHVLLAMGRDPRTAKATIRFSLGRWTQQEDLQYAADSLDEIVNRIGSKP